MPRADHRHTAERLSQRLLYAIVGVAGVVFALFWAVGYDRPSADDPNFRAPLFTDAVLLLMAALTLGAAGAALWSAWRSARARAKAPAVVCGIRGRRIAGTVAAGTAVALALTFALGSTEPMAINGRAYADALWLRVADMFVITTLLLIVVAAGAVVYGATRYRRRR